MDCKLHSVDSADYLLQRLDRPAAKSAKQDKPIIKHMPNTQDILIIELPKTLYVILAQQSLNIITPMADVLPPNFL